MTLFYFGIFAALLIVIPVSKIGLEAWELPGILKGQPYQTRPATIIFFCFDLAMFASFIYYSWVFKAQHERANPLLADVDSQPGSAKE